MSNKCLSCIHFSLFNEENGQYKCEYTSSYCKLDYFLHRDKYVNYNDPALNCKGYEPRPSKKKRKRVQARLF